MSELNKYLRSRQVVMEMIDRLKQKSFVGTISNSEAQYLKINKDVEGLQKTIEAIDWKIASIQEELNDKAA